MNVLMKIIKQIRDYKEKYKKYPLYINITKKQYKRLKKELSIVETITEDIKELYFIEFKIKG